MARLGSRIILEADSFFKRTRITHCINRNCRFIMRDEIQCTFKEISLDSNGFCKEFEQLQCKENTIKGE